MLTKLEHELQKQIKSTKADDFYGSLPPTFQYIELKNPELSVGSKPIKKLRLCTNVRDKKDAFLYIHYQDGTKKTHHVEDSTALAKLLLEANGATVDAFKSIDRSVYAWQKFSMQEVYQVSSLFSTYEKIHTDIISSLRAIFNKNKQEHITIIDGGCGNGQLLKQLETQFGANSNNLSFVGFDFNTQNIIDASMGYQGQCHFIEGNLQQLDQVVSECVEQGYIRQETNKTILVLSGSLTAEVQTGFTSLEILKKAKLAGINYLILSGVSDVLVNDSMARRIGYQREKIQINRASERDVFVYRQLSTEAILINKSDKLARRNFLDLSLSPNPAGVLSSLRRDIISKSYLAIDLSFCDLTDKLTMAIHSLLQEKHNIELIFWTNNKAQAKEFFFEFAWMCKGIDVRVKSSEGYLMAPRGFFNSIELPLFFSSPEKEPRDCIISTLRNLALDSETKSKILLSYLVKKLKKSKLLSPDEFLKIDDGIVVRSLFAFMPQNVNDSLPYIQPFIACLEKKVCLSNQLTLLYVYQHGIIPHGVDPKTGYGYPRTRSPKGDPGKNRKKEIELYQHLAKTYAAELDRPYFEQLIQWKLEESTKVEKTMISFKDVVNLTMS
ncbi:hypothetical protein BN59_01446 [Legionella massiliensis]|uniref:Methyltransferase domain-containing protein n=1 Tax=Legionella massiliensis TaxID=1034943 RepID=A0A078KZF2_9GAMM|nr:hypothetical protein [Legionella massiliensis]CDZ77164.1 hypothetical protein BN59_01446 [Legionella massiliensis]CEE12902.1 hypothetical protein BN1094_01446 [Legionella massiliensis]